MIDRNDLMDLAAKAAREEAGKAHDAMEEFSEIADEITGSADLKLTDGKRLKISVRYGEWDDEDES